MPVVHVVHEEADASVLDVVANAWDRDVEEMALLDRAGAAGLRRRGGERAQATGSRDINVGIVIGSS